MASKCLRELIAQTDERGLAASGLACLERCLPLLTSEADPLGPLWAGLAEGAGGWSGRLGEAREGLARAAPEIEDEAAALIRQMLDAAPDDWDVEPMREWADDCSVAALELHHRLDAGPGGEPAASAVIEVLKGCREGEPTHAGPLVTGELRRQIRVLEILAEGEGRLGLRQVQRVSTEGQRVLRAVVSRRARVKR
ncbi:hypothetical protein NBG84_13680 [Streptomyces sp. CWNU-1]|uniref:Uncharacterized protein n=1 Tax=Streptomyces albipurpureus TaxID=2897419 RepID=A0ABT0UPQ7_9ACTN|nr:hypothetical protein [Streptomyces sp. CWNU-1]MCM2389333.1 hypothetical protein [Streptomyces sp. CWNU-1]